MGMEGYKWVLTKPETHKKLRVYVVQEGFRTSSDAIDHLLNEVTAK